MNDVMLMLDELKVRVDTAIKQLKKIIPPASCDME